MKNKTSHIHIPPALRIKKFRRYFTGLLISVLGSRMQFTALLWHIATLTDQPIALGLVGLARIIPILLLSIISGLIADMFNRRKIILITQSIETLTAATLGILTLTGHIQLWHLYTLTIIESIASAFDLPARQALLPNLIEDKSILPNAYSIQSIAFQLGSIAGPALAGLVLATPWLGQPYTYIFNAISFFAMIFAVLSLGKVDQIITIQRHQGAQWQSIKEGAHFMFTNPMLVSTMFLDFIATFFSSATALLPLFAQEILHVSEVGYGWLSAAQAIGAAAVAITLSQIKNIKPQGPILLISVFIYGAATVAVGLSRTFLPALFFLMLMGAGDAVSTIIRNTIRQLHTPDEMRGRMVSISQIFFRGGPELGELEAGLIAQIFSIPIALISGGIGCILGVGFIMTKWKQLPAYTGEQFE